MANLTQEFIFSKFAENNYKLLSTYKFYDKKLNFICPVGHKHSMSWHSFSRGNRCAICAGQVVTCTQVEKAFNEAGYTLLSRYKNSKTKLDFVCPKGHKHSIAWNQFSKGVRCGICAGKYVTHTQVEKAFNEAGYTLLSQYKGNKAKLDFICSKGHKHSITWNHFSRGNRCAYCVGSAVEHNQVAKAFSEAGYTLLNQYENSKTKLDFVCPKGHKHSITWNHFRHGIRCAYCAGRIVEHEQVEKAFSEAGYTLLNQYKNSKTKLNFICPKGHKHSIAWINFSLGQRCGACAGKQISHEQIEKVFNEAGYTLLTQYKGAAEKLDFICPKGHKHSIAWSQFSSGQRCVYCAKSGYTPSKPARFYYIYFEDLDLYKIGITNRTINERFKYERNKYIVLLDDYYENGDIPRDKEKETIKMFKQYLYGGDKVLESGNSELFTHDIFGLNATPKIR